MTDKSPDAEVERAKTLAEYRGHVIATGLNSGTEEQRALVTLYESLAIERDARRAAEERVKALEARIVAYGKQLELSQNLHGKAHVECSGALARADAAEAALKTAREDERRFDVLVSESWDLRCFDIPTGGDDYDIGWRVVGHWMAEPRERTIAEVFEDNPRKAIDLARATLAGTVTPEHI